VACALAIQVALDQPAGLGLRLRMGISAGRVVVMDGEFYGRALNVAARLEALAAPGDIYLSGAAFDALDGLGRRRCKPLGEMPLAKLATPSRVYRVGRP
jgi:class 3 adenylate cyclase